MIVRGALLVGLVLLGFAACGKPKAIPMLPKVAKYVPPRDDGDKTGALAYRESGGEAIAPVVVQDDPAPTVAPIAGPAKPGGTLNGHPNGITRETVNHSIQSAMGSLAACFTNVTHDPMVAVSFEAEPSGSPSLVRVNGAPPDAERCIRGVMQGVRFPAFEGKGVQIDFPLSFHRLNQPTQPGNPSAEQPGQGNAPPLFLEP
jgi:hypothetical protein